MSKQCTNCLKLRQHRSFNKDMTKPDKLDSWCKFCRKNYRAKNKMRIKNYRKKHSKAFKGYQLKAKFGITIAEYEALASKQKHKCAICDERLKLVVDHCHKTEIIRGLLCNKCNVGLGHFKDDVKIIESAIKYLEEHSK